MPVTQGERQFCHPSPPPGDSTTDNTQQQQIHSQWHPGPIDTPPSTVPSSNHPSDNIHATVPRHSASGVYYGPGSGYSSQGYPLLTAPASAITHNPPFTGYTSSFHDPRIAEGSMTSENPHVRYQPMLQPHGPIYYQQHASAPIRGHFQPMHHYTPLSPSHYSFPPHSFPASPPVFQPYPCHQPTDTQGAWYYLPHPPHQHAESTSVFRTHYPPYPSIIPLEIDNPAPPTSREPSASHRPVRREPFPTGQHRSTPPNQSSSTPQPSLPVAVDHSDDVGVTGTGRTQDKPMVRKPYHPNPPPHRSEWVMWVGNIPSDATHDELWKFFIQIPSSSSSPADNSTSSQRSSKNQQRGNGVISIFLISKSSCVFVNYETEEHLARAIDRFNGKPLRPHDPKCLRLVCRMRKRDDDLKAGVGGQRGQGIHVKWIKEQKLKEKFVQSGVSASTESLNSQALGSSNLGSIDQITTQTSDLALSSDEEGKRRFRASHRNSSGSFASTDSSLLSAFFPKRYFILKSLTQYDLDISVRHGLWATQKHNEGVLDQAYRTSKDVYLIFGVNKSGEFYGYARMAGPVQHGAKNVLWASRTKGSAEASHSPQSPRNGSLDPSSPTTSSSASMPKDDDTWGDVKTMDPTGDINTAPAEMGKPHRQILSRKSLAKSATFELDSRAPLRAVRPVTKFGDAPTLSTSPLMIEGERDQDEDGSSQGDTAWGDCFEVEWLCTDRLPFYWTKNLRNPWNHDREVKISRDGTELEPSVGDMLLSAWELMRIEGGETSSTMLDNIKAPKKTSQMRRQATGGTGGKLATENVSRPSGR